MSEVSEVKRLQGEKLLMVDRDVLSAAQDALQEEKARCSSYADDNTDLMSQVRVSVCPQLLFALNCSPSNVRPQMFALNCLPSTVGKLLTLGTLQPF